MSKSEKISEQKQPRRPHYIKQWAEKKGLKAIELAEALGTSRGQISHWYGGASPGVEWQQRLAEFFGIDRAGLFMHPDEYWLKQFFDGRTRQEVERIKATLEAAFPKDHSDQS